MESTVYRAERVWTLDAERPRAEALAVRDGQVLAVGTQAEVLAAAGQGSAGGGPGRGHGGARPHGRARAPARPGPQPGGGAPGGVALGGGGAPALSRAAASSFQGDWLIGKGWDQNDWPEKAFPGPRGAGCAVPTTPVSLTRVDGHALWVNGEALRRARHHAATRQDPGGGRILRAARGEPTGVLVDNAMDLVAAVLPPPTDAQLEAQLSRGAGALRAGGPHGRARRGHGPAHLPLLQRWDAEGTLPLRVYAMADGQGAERETYLETGPSRATLLTCAR